MSELAGTLRTYRAKRIVGQLRSVYRGPLGGYHSLDYRDARFTAQFRKLTAAMSAVAARHHLPVADSLDAFCKAGAAHGGDNCAAGLSIELPHRSDIPSHRRRSRPVGAHRRTRSSRAPRSGC